MTRSPRPSPPDGLVYIEDTAAGPGIASRLGIAPATVRRWRSLGRGPATFRIGKKVVARISVIEAYLAEREREGLQARPRAA
ncbi:helix-turn-helix domain-containing protein [Streptomyces sp. NPDC093111]|uniref:helix-turn-helix transcriptional regulator n=1 Tax=Streptomyces sp. NPDC093111 TaxID=3154978 RepID=UPI00342E3BA4